MEWLGEFGDWLWRTWLFLTTGKTLAIVLGVAFALLAIGLFIASRTKWGRAKPLTKFVVVSVVLHVWLLMYAVGSRTVLPQGDPDGTEGGVLDHSIAISFEDPGDAIESANADEPITQPWEEATPLAELPVPAELEGIDLSALSRAGLGQDVGMTEPPAPLPALQPTPMPELPPEQLPVEVDEPVVETYASEQRPGEEPAPVADQSTLRQVTSQAMPEERVEPPKQLPEAYQLRQAPNRLQLARAYGADADTEAAVEAGLRWLAKAQSQDGSWNAAAFGAGTETRALNEFRHGTGAKADTGVSGLALLAFLSAGHTHLEGDFQQSVRFGLSYLIESQMPSGDMSGPKQIGNDASVLNSRMYCHSIATLAMAEAYAMTQDGALRESLIKAANYSIKAQDPRGGGWRYVPRDPMGGDLSQFGWQAMALKSVERSGINIPVEVQQRMRLFLDSCAFGRAGGLATYKPRDGRPSDTMTAEALACRLLLNYPLTAEAKREAKSMILRTRPGVGEDNVYFWYYATLALFQLQDDDWRVWNQAMKARLLSTQTPNYGKQPGSWDPDRLWGGYGGRVYSTAMSCLCLEVYYRYLPMYRRDNVARRNRPVWIDPPARPIGR